MFPIQYYFTMWLVNTLYIWLNFYLDKFVGGGLACLNCDFTNGFMATNREHNKNSVSGACCTSNSWGAVLRQSNTVNIIHTHIHLHL